MTRREWNRRLRRELGDAGIEAAETEARLLLEGLLGCGREALVLEGETEVSAGEAARLLAAVERRKSGYPLQYLLGSWEFYGYPFEVGEGVLIPRADTEVLCEAGLRYLRARREEPLRVYDLCSGSGCLAVTLALEEPRARVCAVEKYPAALSYLRRNVTLNRAAVEIIEADVLTGETAAEGTVDLIVSNPPYLTAADMERLQREVRYEPPTALYGGTADGLLFYRTIARRWYRALRPGGVLAFELGQGQAEAVCGILRENGYQNICTERDLCGIIRVATAQR